MARSRDEGAVKGKRSAIEEMPLPDQERVTLKEIARESILRGLKGGSPLEVAPESFSGSLRREGAAFVTLRRKGKLRGCIGSLTACRPLVVDVAENAYAAAFRDPRFSPLAVEEFQEVTIHISVLTPPVELPVQDRAGLLRALRPGVDGLLLEDPPHRATFLPQVWESLPEPERFLDELLKKAGLSPGHWSGSLTFKRYSAEEF
jgi:AmmeMemoRadiSam system protein A